MSDITVAVPCYNHGEYIDRCLRSIFAQTLKPGKLIVINDGSTDDSIEKIEKALADCPFPSKFVSRENKGLSATLNEAFSMVDTDYFAYMASDDLWLPTILEKRAEKIEKRPEAVLAFGHSYLIDGNENIFDVTTNWYEFQDGDVLPALLGGHVFQCHSALFRSKFLRKYKWNEDSILEDYEMYLNLSSEGEFALDDNVLSAWRIHGSNTSDDKSRMFDEIFSAQERCREKLGISKLELREIQMKLKINSVDQFIRAGNTSQAFSILWQNRAAASSKSQIAKLLFRMLIPRPLFQWNRKRNKRKAIMKYGNLALRN